MFVLEKKPDTICQRKRDAQNQIVETIPAKILLYSNLVVADSTGAALVTLPNESVIFINILNVYLIFLCRN